MITVSHYAIGSETILKMDTIKIKGNQELPQVLYVVPWKSINKAPSHQHKLKLHSLFGDFFEPVVPEKPEPIK